MKFTKLMVTAGVALLALSAQAADVVGTSSATFTNPLPLSAVTTGVGTAAFTWGTGANGSPPSSLTFTGASVSSPFNTAFKLGTLTYYNGAVFSGTGAESISFNSQINFTQPALGLVSSSFSMLLNNTTNTGDANADADFVSFASVFSSTNFSIGGVNYQVKITGFQNVVGDGFLTSNASEFRVRENLSASADLYGMVTAVTAVPEPETYAMMLAGLGLMGAVARRRKAKQA